MLALAVLAGSGDGGRVLVRYGGPLVACGAAPALPSSGDYLLRLERSGLCLSEEPTSDLAQVYQAPCDRAYPTMSLRPVGDGVYRIKTQHPRFGRGCVAVDGGPTEEGAALSTR